MKKIYFLYVWISFFTALKAQDPGFLNTNQSLIYLNPSFAGSNGGLRNQFSYRDQYLELASGYSTYLNAFDRYCPHLKGGIAASYLHEDDANGALQSTILSLAYAQYFTLMEGDLKIIPSLQLAYAKRSADLSSFTFGNPPQTTPSTYEIYPEKKYADFSSGILFNYKNKLYLGSSFFHLNQPDMGLLASSKTAITYNVHASYNFVFSERSRLQAMCLFSKQASYTGIRLALNMINFNHLVTGIALVDFNTPAISAGYRNNYFNILLGYDYTLNELIGNKYGAWEIHSSFNLRNKEQRKALTSFETW